ncbi:MAG: ATP-dependent Clp protease ATP-binding subunit [Clostridia bacterium]
MMCSRCKKRPAIVFISQPNNPNSTDGLCLVCAKELGIKPVNDIMSKMGITDDMIESLEVGMEGLMSMEDEDENDDDGFSVGGSMSLPIAQIFGGNKDNSQNKEAPKKEKKDNFHKAKRKNLQNFCTDLTGKARRGELDIIIGRERETERVVQILSRRTKNNPCLIGEPGVGKTAIAEGLALRIANGTVPNKLKKKDVMLLDLTSLVAGTQFRGQFEKRIKDLIDEVKQAGNIILFIDEVHNLVGAGDSEGGMNAANILKPALSRGEIQVVGATTFNEYRKYIEKDSALERRFQPVTVNEPSVAEATEIILGIKSYYEDFHKVKVSEKIAKTLVVLSERYITDRFLPDKAIDILDEACTTAALRNKDLEIFEKLQYDLDYAKAKEQDLSASEVIDYENIAKTRYEITLLEQQINETDMDKVYTNVTSEDLARVIELWTGIPASKIQKTDLGKLSNFDVALKKKIIGQDEAVAVISAATKRSRLQLSPRKHPASFIFVGPTGTGKTELVRVLSKELFDSPETLIRLDMSEFMEKHSVSKIIGSPPGYVGYDEAGQLTEKVRRRPYSVILLDEIEKAHPDVMNVLLQILDEGRVTDAHGRTVNFENTVIVMTSNAGSNNKESVLGFNKNDGEISRDKAVKGLSEFLRPEFLSRIDEIVIFRPLDESDYSKIAALMLDEYIESLNEKGISLIYSSKACDLIAKKSINGKSGARDIRNNIRRDVEDQIASEIIEKGEDNITMVSVDVQEDKILVVSK